MVDIIPFRGFTYNKNKVGNISKVVSPPYDVISADLKKELYNLHPYNIVNLILPAGSGKDKYIEAKKTLAAWIEKEILKPDEDTCFYIIEESFIQDSKIKKISGFIGLTKLEPYSEAHIIPHEKTSSKVKEDRLKLLAECRMDFGMVHTLYNDKKNKINNILQNNLNKSPVIDIKAGYDLNLGFKLWKITDSKYINEIIKFMKDRKLIIADGHHRYETSLNYRNSLLKLRNKNKTNKIYPEDFVLTLYINNSQNDFIVLPTHRILKFKNYPGLEKIADTISVFFHIKKETLKSTNYIYKKLLESKSRGLKSFYLYDETKRIYFITLKSKYSRVPHDIKDMSRYCSNMDINLLNKFFMEKLTDRYETTGIDYTHSMEDIIKNVNSGKFNIGIFLNAPTVEEIEKICSAGCIMPEKSTYFYPKPCTGLVMHKFNGSIEVPLNP
jgi:uncharacterized protein (DUF1015 family)